MWPYLRILLPLLLAGCLNGDYNPPDMSANGPDLTGGFMFDLAGYDLQGLYNCTGLNQCIQMSTTKSGAYMCRNMATPIAVALENSLEDCFVQYCPVDPGKVCAGDAMGMVTPICTMCINNTYIPKKSGCTPTQNPSECHKCVDQANACTADM